jgi:hypothetical protein
MIFLDGEKNWRAGVVVEKCGQAFHHYLHLPNKNETSIPTRVLVSREAGEWPTHTT